MSGLTFWDRGNKDILLDSDNVFWAILKRDKGVNPFVSRELLSLYERIKGRLDTELRDFRFGRELSAIYIDPTNRCNANCPYCYIPAKIRKNGRSMSKKELKFILEKIACSFRHRAIKPVIVFHAAEPLLVKEIIFEAIRDYSKMFKFGLQTNALLLEKGDVKFLKEHRVGVGISLDSFSPAKNNRLRPAVKLGGNFKRAVKALEWFDGYEGLNVITTITKLNVSDLPLMVKFLHTKKVPCVLLNPVRLTQKSSHTLKPDEKDLAKYFIEAVNTAIELSQRCGHRIIVGNFTNIILGIVAPTARRLMCDISPCGGGRCFFTITPSGNAIPCGEFIGLKRFIGGNIFKISVSKIMQSKSFKAIRARFAEKITKCRACIFRNICGAPCPAELSALGNMNRHSVFCEFYKEIIEHAFKIIAEGKEEYCFREESLNNLKYAYRL